jgi:hypothetical protein
MDTIQLYLQQKRQGLSILQASLKFEQSVISASRETELIFQLVSRPFYLCKFARVIPRELRRLAGRAFLADDNFVVKQDEHYKNNSLTFIANLFVRVCKVDVPDMILTKKRYNLPEDEQKDFDENMLQIIEYLPGWEDYSDSHPRSENFAKQLARLVAFDITIYNSDRFLFIAVLMDKIAFADDPDYEQPDDIEDFLQVNKGNFGFVGGDELWSLDHSTVGDRELLNKLHSGIDDAFLDDCAAVTGRYFRLDDEAVTLFREQLEKYFNYNMTFFPLFMELYTWVLD